MSATTALIDLLDAALNAILHAESLDQARGIAHAALNREEYHGLDGDTSGADS